MNRCEAALQAVLRDTADRASTTSQFVELQRQQGHPVVGALPQDLAPVPVCIPG